MEIEKYIRYALLPWGWWRLRIYSAIPR